MTIRTLAETRRANQASDEREREVQVTDRYTKAIEQLGSDKLDVRLGSIYGLERIAVDSERDQRTVVEVLSAFIREHSRPTTSRMLLPIERSRMQAAEPPPARARQDRAATPKPATDVQAAVSVLGRLPSRPEMSRGDLTDAQLSGAQLVGVTLTGADLRRATLSGADLVEATLTDASLSRATLTHANFSGATLNYAHLGGATLIDARLGGATLTGADLGGAILTEAGLGGATLSSASLDRADLRGASLDRADLSGANLATAKNLTQQQLDRARGDEDTKLPDGLQRPAHWSATGGIASGPADE